MNAWVAVTDKDWFDFLSNLAQRGTVDEVNFWQPHPWGGQFRVMQRGEPLLFKLKAPHIAIAGGGFFETYSDLPLSLAWQAFGPKNGAETHQDVWDRIVRLRHERLERWDDPDIGCIVLVEPFFWPEDLWVPQPADWGSQTVRGKRYDLREQPGRALWQQVVTRIQGVAAITPDGTERREIDGGYTDPVPTRHRIGQGAFRVIVTDAYARSCAVTRERALPALEASHIRPFAELKTHSVQNGLLLRSDLHGMFDAGYITVTPDYRVEASQRMKEDFDDGEHYLGYHGARIALPTRPDDRPDPTFLQWHNENRFRG
jgi:putative restriction endonuclease